MEQGLMKKRAGILLTGVIHYMCLGLMYSWSKFSGQIRVEMGLDHGGITLAYSVCMAMFTTGILSDGFLSKKLSSRALVRMGAVLASAGYCITSFVGTGTPRLIYLTYGLFVGFGIGVMYNEWLNNVVQWFPDRSGLASGLLLLGMGLSGITTTPLMAVLAEKLGWRIGFRVISAWMLASGLLSLWGIRSAPAGLPAAPVRKREVGAELSTGRMLRQSCFWTFALWKLILIGLGQACSGQIAQILADTGSGTALQLAAVSLFMTLNGVARLFWGWCCDRLGRSSTMYLVASCCAGGTLLLALGSRGQNALPVFAALILMALSYGGAAILGANYISGTFGRKHYRMNNGVSAATCLPVNLGATALIGMVRDWSGSYAPFFFFALPAALLTLGLTWASEKLGRKLLSTVD